MRRIGLTVATLATAGLAWAVLATPAPSGVPVHARPSIPVSGSVASSAIASGNPAASTRRPAASNGPIVARRIRIDRLGIDLPIVEGDGIDAPMQKAAHYPGTSWPGGGSNIYLYAHAQQGMFLSLWNVRPGDEVDLELVDGSTRAYVIDRVIPKAPWNDMKLVAATPVEQLTLQTSTSNYATAPRFVAIALPKPPTP